MQRPNLLSRLAILARAALQLRSVERAAFGECLNDDERVELLAAIISQMPEARRPEFLREVAFSRSAHLRGHLGRFRRACRPRIISSAEAAFDRHVAPWRERVTKHKGMSFGYLVGLNASEKHDFIYVDGSHHADDVMVDALLALAHLEVGGVMVFDDYLWEYYARKAESPAMGINGFLRLTAGRCRVVSVASQLAVVKMAERGT